MLKGFSSIAKMWQSACYFISFVLSYSCA